MNESNSSLVRMLAVLDAFTPAKFIWTVEELVAHFGYTPASTYRYVKALCKAGLLLRLPRGLYIVGARVIELESLIRETDPVTKEGRPILQELARETGCDALLSNVYGNHLVNVVHEPGVEALELSYLRGRSLPWFKGAPSKAVLAFLPRARVRQLFEAASSLPVSEERWVAAVKELRAIRKTGYCISLGELDPDVIGFGAPVILEEEVIGSVSLVCSTQRARFLNRETIGDALKLHCAKLASRLSGSAMSLSGQEKYGNEAS
jgi:DNA-binding IclR family transcriptional regulator